MNARPLDRLAIAIAQLNPTVGDISGNTEKARRARAQAAGDGADLVAFSELFICGYPPEDLVLKPALQAACLAETGTEFMIVPNGSPYWRDKDNVRLNVAVKRVTESDLPLIYVNQVGGQDELVFDGASFGLHGDRSLAFQLPAFREQVTTVRF